MERLVGVTLGAEVKARGALPVAEALGYVVQVLAGLEVAHAMGIVHRDIKPENVFLCDATRDAPRLIKILDFGVAKVLDVAGEVGRPALPRLVTAEGGIVGTPRVVAPEQALGKPVDARTDVYAAGLLLYTLLAGRGPFAHISDACELLKANVMELPEPPSKWTAQPIPAALDAAVMRALEKRPADRFLSAGAFATELRAIAAAWSRPGPATEVTTGPLPPEGAPASEGHGDDPPREEPTLQLLGARAASAPDLRDRAPTPSHGPGAPDLRSVRRSGTKLRAASAATALATRRGWMGWAAFLALMLLGAALSAVLLFALFRVAP
jgi:serine/threonine-protein kinase